MPTRVPSIGSIICYSALHSYNVPRAIIMAKAKKSTTKSEANPVKSPKAPVGKKAKTTPAPGSPLIDTGLAAQSAARLVMAKPSVPASADTAKKQTAAFRQLKDSMAKGHNSSVQSVLNNSMPPSARKSSTPFSGGKQVGHNQTFGSDASRNSVPRRTGGG